ncbi:MAG: GH92 family glycosyl hydrolase [Prevotella sp.]|nr:GH92 family glycosyl hydrolase [Prevotella sp.]
MKQSRLRSILAAVLLSAMLSAAQGRDYVDYVNPMMGNISHLLVPTFPTVHLPNSMLRVVPERADYTADLLHGLPLITTSHRGRSAFNLFIDEATDYQYDNEEIRPYGYSVCLIEPQVQVRFAVSHQSGIYEVRSEKGEVGSIRLTTQNGHIDHDGDTWSGFQNLDNGTRVYIYLKVDEAELRYGVSFISVEQARKNMERELAGKTFEQIEQAGRDAWNRALGKIEVEGGTDDDRTVFYTSLYRYYERQVCISEDGRYYSAFDHQVHSDHGTPFYTDDWIWDTYRAAHPLRLLIDAGTERDILRSYILMSEQEGTGWIPTFPEVTGDSRRMNSNHTVAMYADALSKGLTDFDVEKAYRACRAAIEEKTLAPWSAMKGGWLNRFYRDHGYIPALPEGEKETLPDVNPNEKRQPVAVTLGTSYDEWCLSRIASFLSKKKDANYYQQRSQNYRNIYNPATRFFHPKDSLGQWIEPFDYRFSGGMGAREFYGENNGWVYRWDVQHDIAGLIRLHGGPAQFCADLDQTFREPLGRSKFEFFAQLPDHTGNVGQFSMANEPSLHVPYLYNYAGQAWKTQKRIRELLRQWFRNDLMGLPGDEDGGGMSAFVVFSMAGLYPVTPGRAEYAVGSPVFTKVRLHLSNGRTFTIEAPAASARAKYVSEATLDGQQLPAPFVSHEAVARGATLRLQMTDRPAPLWGED